MNRRTVTFTAVAAVLLAGAAGAARVALGHTPAGYERGYSPPDTVVLVGADGVTLWAGGRGRRPVVPENRDLPVILPPASSASRSGNRGSDGGARRVPSA